MTRKQFLKSGMLAVMSAVPANCSLYPSSLSEKDIVFRQKRLLRIRSSKNHDGKSFKNTVETYIGVKPGKRWEAIRKLLGGDKDRVPSYPLPTIQLDKSHFAPTPRPGLRIVWLGHASLIIEIDGKRFLTDPVWSEHLSPVSFIGPKRSHLMPIPIDSLPKTDGVLISHDHRDHLDEPTIKKLMQKDMPFFVPLGVGRYLQEWGVPTQRIIEKDWGEVYKSHDGSFTCIAVPSRHFSGRILIDECETLWTSWIILGRSHRVFFCGDTGLLPHFTEIGRQFGPFDMTFLPIGAYDPCWPDIHLTPEQAVEAHQMLNGDLLVPIHWATFNLAPHTWYDPPQRLRKYARNKSVKYVLPKPGQIVALENIPQTENWWVRV